VKTLTAATSTFSSTTSFPEDGVDARTAASLETSAKRLLDNDGFLNSLGLVRKIARNGGTGAATSTAFTVSSASYADSGAQVQITPNAGDLLIVIAHASMARTGANDGNFHHARLTWQSLSLAQAQLGNSECEFMGANGTTDAAHVVMVGYATAAFAETYTLKIQAREPSGATGDLSIRQDWEIIAIAIKPPA
jgi:hypothetical protein